MIKLVREGKKMHDCQKAHMIAASSIPTQVIQGVELMHIYHQQNVGVRINGACAIIFQGRLAVC
jgi:hypothetical protein